MDVDSKSSHHGCHDELKGLMVQPALIAQFCSFCGVDIQAMAECPKCGARNEFLNVTPPPPLVSGRTGEEYGVPPEPRIRTAPKPQELLTPKAPAATTTRPPAAVTPQVPPAAASASASAAEADDDVTSPLAMESDDRTMPLPIDTQDAVVAILLCEEGFEGELRFELRPGEAVLGRKKAELVVASEHISTKHSCFYTGKNSAGVFEVAVADLGSVNGTFVNGDRLAADQKKPLKDSDIVKVANVTFLFREHSPT